MPMKRRDATDAPAVDKYTGDYRSSRFIIEFEKSGDAKKRPASTCSNPTSSEYNGLVADGALPYRTGCAIDRMYVDAPSGNLINVTTWATHPAFTFGDEELNGIWIGKFLATPSLGEEDSVYLAVKPNAFISGAATVSTGVDSAADFYQLSKSVGQTDANNTGGSELDVNVAENSHNLSDGTSHLVKNSEWGAIAYLSSSRYGAGSAGVIQENTAFILADVDKVYGDGGLVTGCGTVLNLYDTDAGDQDNLLAVTGAPIDFQTAVCSISTQEAQYNGNIGVKSSSTVNAYGVYDLATFSGNLVAATRINTNDAYSTDVFDGSVGEPYVNVFSPKSGGNFGIVPSWYPGGGQYEQNYLPHIFRDTCTFELCGGQAIHEVASNMPLIYEWGGSIAQGGYFPDNTSWVRGILDGAPALFGLDEAREVYDGIPFVSPWERSNYMSPRVVIKPE